MPDINGIPYVDADDLVSAYPAVSQSLAQEVSDQLASKADYPSGGTDGDLLTKSGTSTAWASSSVAGLTLITSETFSAVTTLLVNSCFSATYQNYFAKIIYTSSNASHFITLRLSASGVTANTNYKHQRLYGAGASAAAAQNTSATSFECWYGDNTVNAGEIGFYRPNEAASTPLETRQTGSSASQLNLYGGQHTDSTAYDGFEISINSGTISGTIRVYGYKD